MPQNAKWSLIVAISMLCGGGAYLMISRGPAMLLDLGGALLACF